MNILFLIGNGFDVNLGMPTRYSDFYKYYQKIESKSDLILKLKANISKKEINWSDLELALGAYTQNISSLTEFDEMFIDIQDNLADYLIQKEKEFDFSTVDKNKLLDYLCNPEKPLLKADYEALLNFRRKWKRVHTHVDIISFNYTYCIERIIGDKYSDTLIGTFEQSPVTLNDIHHIHGSYTKRMIIGVDNALQIANKSFYKNDDILDTLIKSRCNSASKQKVDDDCLDLILDANLICVFGSSIGETDKTWWEHIGATLGRECRLIIFTKSDKISERREQYKERIVKKVKDDFLNKTKLTDSEKEQIRNKIFVGVNTEMFKLK